MKGRLGHHSVTIDPRRVRGGASTSSDGQAASGKGRVVKSSALNRAAVSGEEAGWRNPARAPAEQVLFIPGLLPGLNELLDAQATKRVDGRRGSVYTTMKQQYGQDLYWQILKAGLKHVERARFSFTWIERDEKRDLDNITAGGRKVVLDALVKAGVLTDDSQRYVLGWEDAFLVDPTRPGIHIVIHAVE